MSETPVPLPPIVFTEARFVLMTDMDGIITKDQWVNAKQDTGQIHAFDKDDPMPEWQAYLAGGGTIDPYIEPALPPSSGPELSVLYPKAMPASVASFELMLMGNNFAMNTIVLFNGEKVPALFMNRQQILASLTGGNWRQPGEYTVAAVSPDENLTHSKSAELVFTFEEVAPPVQQQKRK